MSDQLEVLRVAGSDGSELAVRLHGRHAAATPVLAVHGLASNARLWDGVAAELVRRGHPVAALDQRGHGRSAKPAGGYDFATLTEDLLAVIGALGWSRRPVVATGQSFGGNVVVELAARHPSSVAALVLVDGGTITLSSRFADWPTCMAALTPPPLEGRPLLELEGAIRRAHPDWPESGIEATLANFEVRPDKTVRPWLSLQHHLTILRALWEHHPLERLALVRAPVLLVAAGDPAGRGRGELVEREQVEAAGRVLARFASTYIDGDHDLHAQHPERIGELIAGAADGSVFAPATARAEGPPSAARPART